MFLPVILFGSRKRHRESGNSVRFFFVLEKSMFLMYYKLYK